MSYRRGTIIKVVERARARFNLPPFIPGETPSAPVTETSPFDEKAELEFRHRRGSYPNVTRGEIPDGLDPKERGRFVIKAIHEGFAAAGMEIPDGTAQHELRNRLARRNGS